MKKTYELKSIHSNAPDISFSFNTATGRLSGKNAQEVRALEAQARKVGVVYDAVL